VIAPAPARTATARITGVELKTKVWLERDGRFVIGDGGVHLLLGVLEHGSLLGAARTMGWSYRHAWGYLRRAERALGAALVEARPGKGASRGMVLSEAGRQVLERLAAIRNQLDDLIGPSGPTDSEVAARGKRRGPRRPVDSPRPRGDWRTRR